MSTKKYANPAQVAMAYRNLNQAFNGSPNVVMLPQEGWDEKQWSEYRAKIGAGNAPEEYEITRQEGVTYDEEALKWFQGMGHKHSLPKRVVEEIINGEDGWNAMIAARDKAAMEAFQAHNAAELEKVTTRWGDNLEPFKAAGKRAVQALKLDDATMASIENNIGAAALIDLLARIGSATSEGTFRGAATTGDPNDPAGLAPQVAAQKAQELMMQPGYMDPNAPNHQALVQQVRVLMERSTESA